MGRLGDVLEAIYDAPRLDGALHARAHQVHDLTRVREVHDWWSRQVPGGPSAGALLITSSEGVERAETDHELWLSAAGRWRADASDHVCVLADDEVLAWNPVVGGVRHPAAGWTLPAWESVLRPRWLLDWFDVTVGDDSQVAGRACWSLLARPTRLRHPFHLGMPDWHGSEVECSIDQATGIALAYVARHRGAAIDSWTTTVFEPGPSIDDAVFAFTPPDGSTFRDPHEVAHEAMLRSAAEAGVDLTGVDTGDHEAVRDAFMQHHHRGFFGPIAPEEQAEQYVAVGPLPDDPVDAEARIRDAFEQMFTVTDDGAIPAVQGGANLGPSLVEAGQRAPGPSDAPATVRVEHVKLLGRDDAVAWFAVERDAQVLLPVVTGRARRIGGRWLVARETFAQLVGAAGVRCPPPP